jgi:hypothetical protein
MGNAPVGSTYSTMLAGREAAPTPPPMGNAPAGSTSSTMLAALVAAPTPPPMGNALVGSTLSILPAAFDAALTCDSWYELAHVHCGSSYQARRVGCLVGAGVARIDPGGSVRHYLLVPCLLPVEPADEEAMANTPVVWPMRFPQISGSDAFGRQVKHAARQLRHVTRGLVDRRSVQGKKEGRSQSVRAWA